MCVSARRSLTVSQRDRRRSSADGLESLGRTDLSILEVGCGSGWFCPQLMRFGVVTGTDLSDEGLARAQQRAPEATFVAGDFMSLDLRTDFDVVVTLEVLSHVLDQRAFIGKLASHLRPGGHLMLATQNRFVLQYLNWRPPPGQDSCADGSMDGSCATYLNPSSRCRSSSRPRPGSRAKRWYGCGASER
jgi:2-polyprenyl-3-methyl-5-hydroxy-6-metoxy-1,4-benzoquinol methylase